MPVSLACRFLSHANTRLVFWIVEKKEKEKEKKKSPEMFIGYALYHNRTELP